jgi:hypothetical protein
MLGSIGGMNDLRAHGQDRWGDIGIRFENYIVSAVGLDQNVFSERRGK